MRDSSMIVYQVKSILKYGLFFLSCTRTLEIQVHEYRDIGGGAEGKDLMKKFRKYILFLI